MAGKPEIHTTELKTFKRCRRKWAIGELAALQPQKRNMNFLLGTAVHSALEEWSATGDEEAMLDAFLVAVDNDTRDLREQTPWLYAEQEADIIEAVELGREMVTGYIKHWYPETFTVLRAGGKPLLEVAFSMPILTPDGKPTGYTYAGKMDGVVKDEYGIWILERKTTSNTNAEYLRLDDQNVMYLAYAQKMWPKIVPHLRGVYYDFLRKQRPGPRVKSPLFFRERVYRNQHEIDYAMEHVYYVVQDMIRVAKDPDNLAYPSPTKDCSWDCPYKQLCKAMNDGTDVDTIVEAGFVILSEGRNGWVSDWFPKGRV